MTNRHMTTTDEQRIVAIIDSWDEPKITWQRLMERIHQRLGLKWTYPTLTARKQIVEHFEIRKSQLKGGEKRPPKTDDIRLDLVKQKLAKKDEEIAELRALLAKYDERFARYVYNAHALANLTPEVLNTPLPDLGRSRR